MWNRCQNYTDAMSKYFYNIRLVETTNGLVWTIYQLCNDKSPETDSVLSSGISQCFSMNFQGGHKTFAGFPHLEAKQHMM